MIKGRLVFKTEAQAGKVCVLLNEINFANYDKRMIHFGRAKKALFYEIYEEKEQRMFDKALKKFKSGGK